MSQLTHVYEGNLSHFPILFSGSLIVLAAYVKGWRFEHFLYPCYTVQGCKFSDFNLISDFFTLTPLKTIFEISTFEYI